MQIAGAMITMLSLAVVTLNTYGIDHTAARDSSLVFCTTPTKFDVRGDFVTDQYGGRKVILSGSQPGIRYDLMYEGATVYNGSFFGTGSGYAFPAVYGEGVYTVVARDFNGGVCTAVMNGSYVHTHIIVPQVQIVFGGGSFCEGSAGATIRLSASENHVKYQLKKADGTPVRDPLDGCCGRALSWSNITEAGSYTVTAVSGNNSVSMTGSASVAVRSQQKYNVAGTGSFITGQSDIPITLSGSQPGVKYQLLSEADSYKIGLPQDGTGNSLQWHIPAASGHLLVQATDINGCVAEMNGRAIVSVTGFQIDQTLVDGLAFKYKYDDQRRMIARKIPGKDWEYLVYDDLDRLVLTQDGEQRKANQWTFTKYDEMDRPMATGIKDTTVALTQAQMQGVVNDYYALASTTKPWRRYGERFVGATTANSVHGYTNKSYPQVTTSGTASSDKYLTITYYDNYTFRNDWPTSYLYGSDALSATVDNGTVYTQPTVENQSVKGQVTGTKVKVLDGGATWLKSISYYDDKYRMIQAVSDNIKGGIDRTSNLYDFVGKVLKTKTAHGIAGATSQNIVRSINYDHGGRPLKIYHSMNDATTPVLLVANDYNELGQLVDKKLHSTVSAGAKQSVDYRYNIRGWLTSINNAALSDDHSGNNTNDDPNDLFGMNLAYNTGLGFDATPQFNGNISAITYSKDWGKGDIKQTGYRFAYDPLNRLTHASHKQLNTLATWEAGGFDEGSITYDNNGNIQTLQRRGKNGVLIDDLKYIYSTPDFTASNKLLAVEDQVIDAANKAKGFIDGHTGTTQDYTYDGNGNMTRDLNKGIGTSTTDGTNVIAYNHLNLPQVVTKGGSTIRYLYDATGRKLSQYVTMGTAQKRTDYVGEFVYEGDVLQFINHEEGRITVSTSKPIYSNSFEATTDITAVNTTLSLLERDGEKYVVVATNNTTTGNGVLPIGNSTIEVNGGERYKIRVKGYSGTSAAYLQVKIGTTLHTTSALLPNSTATEAWVEQVVTIPGTGVTTLQAGVLWNTVTTGEKVYLNEFEIMKLETTAPEYQYHLKDHLGNVRLTFTSKDEVDTNKATLESAAEEDERAQFVRYDDVRLVRSAVFDHTNNSNPTSQDGRAVVLRGGDKEITGLVKTLSVMPGDVISMKVYAKYMGGNRTLWSQVLTDLAAAVAAGTAGVVTDGNGYVTNGYTPFKYLGDNGTGNSNGTGPKAYLNYIMFDRDFNPILGDISQTFYKQVSTDALEDGSTLTVNNTNGKSHELLEATVTAKQAGYLYIYLSNEETSPVELFFDDFEVEHTKSPVVQSEEYYPFGLTFNSYSRENSVPQDVKFNGKEEQNELSLGWLDYGARMYDASLGRWNKIDRLSEKFAPLSPYAYAACNPIIYIDINGDDIYYFDEKGNYTGYMVKDDGPNRGVYHGEEFIFGDQEHDHLNLVQFKEGEDLAEDGWFRVEAENGLDIDRRVEEAGAYDVINKWDGLKKILEKKGEGSHDMGVGMEHDDAKFGTHTIISTAKGKVSFSSRNYGNFLLAITYAVMTDGMIDGEETKILADLYEKVFTEKWGDSRDDQKAIELGGMYYEDHYSGNGNTGKYNKMPSDKNYSDDFLKWYYDKKD